MSNRERAWTAEQAHLQLMTKLLNIKTQAASAMTQDEYTAAGEKAIRALPEIIATLRQQAERGDGAVSDEAALTLDAYLWKEHGVCLGKTAMRAALEAVAPLLRAPAEQGGRVDGACTDIDSPFNACMYRDHCRSMQAALAQNAQGEAVAMVGRTGASIGALFWTPEGQKADLPDGTKLYTRAERARVPDARTGVYVTHDDAVTLREIRLAQPPSLRDSAFIGRPLLAIAQRIEATMLAAAQAQPEDAA